MKGLFTKTYATFLFGFLGIIALAVVIIFITSAFKNDTKEMDASDVNFAQPQDSEEN